MSAVRVVQTANLEPLPLACLCNACLTVIEWHCQRKCASDRSGKEYGFWKWQQEARTPKTIASRPFVWAACLGGLQGSFPALPTLALRIHISKTRHRGRIRRLRIWGECFSLEQRFHKAWERMLWWERRGIEDVIWGQFWVGPWWFCCWRKCRTLDGKTRRSCCLLLPPERA